MRKLALFGLALGMIVPCHQGNAADEIDAKSIVIESPETHAQAAGDQLLTLQVGGFQPRSVGFDNGSYRFDYGSINSYLAELGWAGKMFDFGRGGSFYLEESLAVSTFSGDVSSASAQGSGVTTSSYSLYLLGFDTRVMFGLDQLPLKWVIPFVDGGYQYSLYYQPASSGLESAEGGVGNWVAGAGVRFWLNSGKKPGSGFPPFYLSVKYNRIFASASSLDLASSSVLGGVSLGF